MVRGELEMSDGWKFQIKGRVQGVWFRESTRQQAEPLGLCGYAINCPDTFTTGYTDNP